MSQLPLNTDSIKNPSLRHYLQKTLLLWAGCLFLVFCLVIYQVYEWGLDDSSEYYLLQDALYAKGLLETNQALPANTAFRKFYVGKDALPPYLKAAIFTPKNPYLSNNINAESYFYVEDKHAFYYILAMPLKNDKANLFVVHRFTLDDEAPGLSLESLMLMCAILVLLVSLVLAVILYKGITTPLKALTAWCQAMPDNFNSNSNSERAKKNGTHTNSLNVNEPPYEQLHFLEFHYLAKRLYEHQLQLIHLTQQEKDFLNSLSHELRTPMAIIRAALDIFAKQNLPKTISNKLLKIEYANLRMMQLSESLLYLWKNEPQNLNREAIDAQAFMANIIEEHAYLLTDASQTIPCLLNDASASQLLWQVNPIYLHICISNLLRNALQHGEQNSITLSCGKESLIIANTVSPQDEANPNHNTVQESGFGLGLQLARRIADQQGWQLVFSQSANVFSCQLIFTP